MKYILFSFPVDYNGSSMLAGAIFYSTVENQAVLLCFRYWDPFNAAVGESHLGETANIKSILEKSPDG